jgi:hypothetical protein
MGFLAENPQRILGGAAESQVGNLRRIGNCVDGPRARGAFAVIAERAVVMMMMDDADDERDAEIQQANQSGCCAGFHVAGSESGARRRESQAREGGHENSSEITLIRG